jgi:hypothetical protein
MAVFPTLKEALDNGWTVYDRWAGGYILTQRIAGKTEVAIVELREELTGPAQ